MTPIRFKRKLVLCCFIVYEARLKLSFGTVPEQTLSFSIPSNSIRLMDAVLMLEHCLQLWPNINLAFTQPIGKKALYRYIT